MPKMMKTLLRGLLAAVALLGLAGVAMAETPVLGDVPLGNPNAPVTVIEYASLTCPHCAHFNDVTMPEVKKKLIDTGKIQLIYRDFPLDQMAVRAAMLARCGGASSYHGFIDVLFRQQIEWAAAKDPNAALRQIGRLGGISDKAFDACMADKQVEDAVLNSRLQAQQKYQIDSTPSFVIGGKVHAGALSFDEFDKLVEPLIEKAGGKPAPAK